VTLLSISFFVL
jgi:hypothetical protein